MTPDDKLDLIIADMAQTTVRIAVIEERTKNLPDRVTQLEKTKWLASGAFALGGMLMSSLTGYFLNR
jgi:hypothetical protein